MVKKQFKTKRWWRVLPLLLVCLFAGNNVVQAKISFSSAPTRIYHQPTMTEPYIVVEVLYFDAMGNDSYFTTATQEGSNKGPAVYMKKSSESSYKWICSPFAELAWNTHQQTAESDLDQDGWWKSNNPELPKADRGYEHTYNNNDVIIRFYNPHRRSDRDTGEYYVYMYIFVKEFQVGDSYNIKIRGTWKVNEGSPSVQEKVLTTDALSNLWSAPSAVLTADHKVTVFSNDMPTNLPSNTTVGIYTTSKTTPSGYLTSAEMGSSKSISKSSSSYSAGTVPAASFDYSYDYLNGGTIPVQYSYSYSSSVNSYYPTFSGSAPIVYKWFSATYPGFVYPTNVTYEVTDPWTKKVKVSWDAEETQTKTVGSIIVASYSRSQAGTWRIKNLKTNTTVDISKYATQSGEIEVDDYSIGNNFKKDDIYVYFVPKDYTGDPIASLGDSVQAMIKPKWSFSKLEAKENETENGGIDLSWSHNAIEDATSSKKYTLVLQRCTDYDASTDKGNWADVTSSIEVKDKKTVEGSYNDHSSTSSNTTYYYRLKAEVMGMTVYSAVASIRLGGSKIKTFTATRGNYSSMVKLQWTVKQAGTSATNFILQRRPLGSEDERDWADIYATSGTVTSYSYDDVTALPGSFNDYKIIIWSTVTDETTHVTSQVVDDSQTTDGFSVSTGIISGNISYGTGTAVKDAKVVLKQQTADGSLASGMHSLRFSGYGSGLKYATDKEALKALFDKDFSFQMYLNPNSAVMATNETEYQLLYVADVLDVKLKCVVGTKETTEMVEVTTGEGEEQTTTYEEHTETVTAISYSLSGIVGGATIASTLSIPANVWSHLSLVYDSNAKKLTAYLTKADETQSEVVATASAASIWGTSEATALFFGNAIVNVTPEGGSQAVPTEFASSVQYDGYLDEIRFFTKALTEDEILHNYNHLLAGNEAGLAIYYPLDEGLEKQDKAYDFSKKNGVSNGRHASAKVPAASSTTVLPSENQLSLMGYTDENGYYEIRGVPFSGEGTSYSVIPTLGIHEFSPAKHSRYVSISTLNHSGVDFEDVSSFPVSGTVFYAGSDYPLEGANFYVDGSICAKDGEIIQTNEKGEFTISVPIGDHFITVKKNGHVFANAGRYPADPNNVETKHTFDREIKNLEFTDETLVNFTGRVVGGDIEGKKTVGFRMSKNNIGKVQLVLTPQNTKPRMNVVKIVTETTYSYETNSEIAPIASATDRIESNSYRGAGAANCRRLFIETDPETGEFSAMLPPLEYAIESMTVMKSGLSFGDPVTIDLSNPLMESSDTLHNDDGTDVLYPYHTALKYAYHSTPTFIVTQQDHYDKQTKTNDGAFGIKSYQFKDVVKTKVEGKDVFTEEEVPILVNDIYSIVNGKPVYKYGKGTDVNDTEGAAVFVMNDLYSFDIEAFEEYENADDATAVVTDHVPLANTVVTINNALSSEQAIAAQDGEDSDGVTIVEGQIVDLKSNQLMLDEEGKATYSWIAGLPNIIPPFTRTITITYDIGDRTYPWSGNGMKGIILGSLPSGNNFVTSGPDVVDMILRDPPGSGSSAEWTSGTVSSFTRARLGTHSTEAYVKGTACLGTKQSSATGFGVYLINTFESRVTIEGTLTAKEEFEGGNTFSRTIEATKTISTSDDPDYVGAQGDVFIGQATNIIFGKARNVDFHRKSADSNEVELKLEEIIATGLSFGTMFNYTQKNIEEDLLPNLESLRNSYLLGTKSLGENEPHYQSKISQEDPRFGTDNDDPVWGDAATSDLDGPSYKMILPQSTGTENFTDQVKWCNSQIATWKNYLALNEMEKVRAYENRNDKDVVKSFKNFSFDSGTKVTNSYEKQEGDGFKYEFSAGGSIRASVQTGGAFDYAGIFVDVGGEFYAGGKHEHEESDLDKIAFNYTLAESGTNDALTVDVYEYGDYGPIFRTLGGQTSAPYEGKVETKYYDPGSHTIMEATMQVEVPQIKVDKSFLSDVPAGSAANYTLRLGNASEVNKDVTYKLFVLDGTNPDGAQITVDGQVLTEGRLINVPGGQEITKSLQLRQTNASVLDYLGCKDPTKTELFEKGIGIVFASESQPEDIADTVFISAKFTPSSSPVELALSKTLMNTQTGTNLTLTFKDFDRNYKNLKAFRLQYKRQGANDWTQIQEYVLGTPTGNQLKLPETASVSYDQPMASFPDGEYMFRVVSASTYGDEEVYRYSNEIALVKDMQKPTPLGQPEPADGVLDIGDDLSITFNEIIMKGDLTKVKNFKVTGVLNGAKVAHLTALSLQNTENATAATEASINLAGKDFSFDAWVNLEEGGGTLLSHGNGSTKFTVGTDASGKLVVGIGKETYTSTNIVPTGKWAFLTLSYKATETGGLLNASVADDANTTNLFIDQAVVSYNGNGSLAVGKNVKGSIHELLLWDEAHDLTTALLNSSVTKNPSTRHLIGYWKMDEGEGTEIRDYSRNRHMTMPSATWYLNNENKAITLDGSHFVSIDASQLPVCVDDDYAVEFWMRGDMQSDAQLLQMGEIALWVKADGTLQLTGKGAYDSSNESVLATSATKLTDNTWHHVALNVLRQGSAAVYVDGKRCLTTSASNVGSITTNNLIVGARRVTQNASTGQYIFNRPFSGQIDEVRVWNATMNGDLLAANRKVRMTGKEDGLVAYYPFETQTLDSGNQVQAVGSDADLTGSGLKAQLKTFVQEDATLAFTDEAPAMRQKPTETNVSFTFVASNEKVVITIDEDPATIEGCTLNFTVRDVLDENGNYSDPAIWSAYVNRNELVWADDALAMTQPVRTENSVTATIVNKSGKQQMWTLAGLPSWLTASAEYGTTNPLAETQVTFTVSESTAVGNYEETIYLVADNGIETPLTLHVKVTGNVPDWAVNANDFENSMNVIGQLDILGVQSEDEDDIVAAFVGEECRGVAQPVYNKRYDSYYVTMDIYGEEGEVVTFRAYDASAGIIYPLVDIDGVVSMTFAPLALKGSYNVPTALAVQDRIEQAISLAKGWNWISLGVKTDDMTVPTLFADVAKDVLQFKGHSQGDPVLENVDGVLKGSNASVALNNKQMYAVKMDADRTLRLVGQRLDPAENPIALASGWNWIGYYGLQVSSVKDALAGMTPTDGELIKGQRGVAYFDDYEWSGSLVTLVPGQGYVVKSTSARSFSYPAKSVAAWAPGRDLRGAESVAATAVTADTDGSFTPVDYHMYSSNMVLVTRVEMDGQPLCGVELGIFAGDECRSTVTTNDEGIAYAVIPGDDPVTLSFKVAIAGTTQGETTQTIEYNTDDTIGSSKDPFVITLNPTGIDAIEALGGEAVWYDLSGRRLEAAPMERGIYVVTVSTDGRIATHLVRR